MIHVADTSNRQTLSVNDEDQAWVPVVQLEMEHGHLRVVKSLLTAQQYIIEYKGRLDRLLNTGLPQYTATSSLSCVHLIFYLYRILEPYFS